jgi:hypothetical protein
MTSAVIQGYKPIIFSTAMVKAITSGKKTQTRRIIKPHNFPENTVQINPYCDGLARYVTSDKKSGSLRLRSPYGYPEADKIWVRETFAIDNGLLVYKADIDFDAIRPEDFRRYSWKPAIHMPRDASRLILSVLDLRVQRLSEISEEDALKEGVGSLNEFKNLWINLNGDSSWEANPWVWVIDFSPRFT